MSLQRQTASLQENNTTLQTQNAKVQVSCAVCVRDAPHVDTGSDALNITVFSETFTVLITYYNIL